MEKHRAIVHRAASYIDRLHYSRNCSINAITDIMIAIIKTSIGARKEIEKLIQSDILYIALVKAVKENSGGMEIGTVRAILTKVDAKIASLASRNEFATITSKLTEKIPD